MEFDVTVYLVLPEVTGEGARGQWKKQEVVFNLPGEFNRKLCVGFWNDRAPMAAALRPGDHVMVSVNLESRERNGRWFTEARGWKLNQLPSVSAEGAYGAPQGYGAAAPSYNNSAAQPNYGAPQASYPAYNQPSAAPAPAGVSAPQGGGDDLPF
ncbi:MAG: DUF3127 domain-containing protein [Mucinivorans sp.]